MIATLVNGLRCVSNIGPTTAALRRSTRRQGYMPGFRLSPPVVRSVWQLRRRPGGSGKVIKPETFPFRATHPVNLPEGLAPSTVPNEAVCPLTGRQS